jgi:MoxR-like ATPase
VTSWQIYEGDGVRDSTRIARLPKPPPWRNFVRHDGEHAEPPGHNARQVFLVEQDEVAVVNAALYLRRPLLVTGPPGTGKSTLAHAVADELDLGDVLVWPVTSHSTLKDALYSYDAIGRLQQISITESTNEASLGIGEFVRLGPLGTAFADSDKPRVLLIDEIDKCDIDLPNDLLHIFETGQFTIPELARYPEPSVAVYVHESKRKVEVSQGRVVCRSFPFVVLTSNGERELPAAFLRRCLRLEFAPPTPEKLGRIVAAHFDRLDVSTSQLLTEFIREISDRRKRKGEYIATDQLLNAIYLVQSASELKSPLLEKDKRILRDYILRAIAEIDQK